MAKLILMGDWADVQLFAPGEHDGDEELWRAECVRHPDFDGAGCGWREEYDDLNDASEYATYHADTGRR